MLISRPRDKSVGVPRASRSEALGVSVSALFDPSVVDLGGELQHISEPLKEVLIQLTLDLGADHGDR